MTSLNIQRIFTFIFFHPSSLYLFSLDFHKGLMVLNTHFNRSCVTFFTFFYKSVFEGHKKVENEPVYKENLEFKINISI